MRERNTSTDFPFGFTLSNDFEFLDRVERNEDRETGESFVNFNTDFGRARYESGGRMSRFEC